MLAFALSAVLIVIDQIVKHLVTLHLKPLGSVPFIPGVINFTYVENRGAAFGMLENQRWLFVAATIIACGVLVLALLKYRKTSALLSLSLSLILGGAIGNLIDRVAAGFVVDFIEPAFVNFAVFNFADCCVTVGAVLLGIYLLFIEGSKKGASKQPEENGKEA